MAGQQRRGGPRPGGAGGRLGTARSGGASTGRVGNDSASQPRSARLGAPRTGGARTGNPRTGNQSTGNPRSGDPRTGNARTGTARPTRGASGRPVARPAVARRSAGSTQRVRAARPHRFTGRATVLVLVLGALLLAYAYPVRIYLNQQAEIAALQEHQREQTAHIADLQVQSDKWNDPAYIKAQARSRLLMGEPGETIYAVVDGGAPASSDPDAGKVKDTGPWYEQLWSSVKAADQPKQTK